MKKIITILFIFFIYSTLSFATPGLAAQPFALVELYTSEGCSSCPSAEQFLNQIAQKATQDDLNIMTLEFHVDYWNYLGWKDNFSDARFTNRQRQYSNIWGENNIYTPQIVVNGTYGSSGLRRSVVQQHIDTALKAPAFFDINIDDYHINDRTVSFDVTSNKNVATVSVVNVALVERGISVDVKSGENGGRRLEHTNLVRYFDSLPFENNLRHIEFMVPEEVNLANASVIVYVQQKMNMMVTAAVQRPFLMEK